MDIIGRPTTRHAGDHRPRLITDLATRISGGESHLICEERRTALVGVLSGRPPSSRVFGISAGLRIGVQRSGAVHTSVVPPAAA